MFGVTYKSSFVCSVSNIDLFIEELIISLFSDKKLNQSKCIYSIKDVMLNVVKLIDERIFSLEVSWRSIKITHKLCNGSCYGVTEQ